MAKQPTEAKYGALVPRSAAPRLRVSGPRARPAKQDLTTPFKRWQTEV